MILVLGTFFAQAHYLSRPSLAGDIEAGHLDSGGSPSHVYYRPHSVNDKITLIGWNRQNLRLRPIESARRSFWPVFRPGWIVTYRRNRAHLLQKMRDVHLAFHPNRRMRAQQSNWCQHVLSLS